jgi:undecaprenyl-diphosphatase
MQEREKEIIILLLILAITILSFCFDNYIINFFSSIRNIYLNQLFFIIKFLDIEIFIIIFVTLLLIWNKKKRKWILPLWITFGITALASFILKIIIRRPRPFVTGIISLLPGIVDSLSYHIWNFSFPSFDSAFIFCSIPIISKFYPKFKYIWIIFAGLVVLSRVYFGLHYLSDALSGALIGYLIGFIFLKLEEKYKFCNKIYKKILK